MQATTNTGNPNTTLPKDAGNDARLVDVATKAASDVAHKAAQTARGLAEESRAAATQHFDATTKWVDDVTREHPMRTLGIVAAVGVVVGLLIGRR